MTETVCELVQVRSDTVAELYSIRFRCVACKKFIQGHSSHPHKCGGIPCDICKSDFQSCEKCRKKQDKCEHKNIPTHDDECDHEWSCIKCCLDDVKKVAWQNIEKNIGISTIYCSKCDHYFFDKLSIELEKFEESSKIQSKLNPYKCPVCDGTGYILTITTSNNSNAVIHTEYNTECHACDKGILWR